LKTAYRNQVERLNRGGVDTVGKEHFTFLYSPARDSAIIKRNIRAGWAATSLFPFNPERVLKDIPKPPADLVIPRNGDAARPCPSAKVVHTPITPVTPVTAKALTTLHEMIKDDTQTLDKASRQRVQRRIQKLASTARVSFAERALLQNHNRFLFKINNEVKVRRSTRSVVLGKAKVMSYEDLDAARAKRAAKEKDAASKKKGRGRKRKSPPALEADVGGPSKAVRLNEAVAPTDAPVTWRAQ
jgi:hypothetical protein